MRRRTPKPDSLSAINGKLDAYIREHCPITQVDGWPSRRHLTREELSTVFAEAGCRWEHFGENYCEYMT